MSVVYNITELNGTLIPKQTYICYHLHYGALRKYTSMQVFAKKHYLKANGKMWTDFTSEEVFEYVRLLNVMGLNFTMEEQEDEYVFTVPLSANPIMHNKMILNCVRYLCEDNFPGIVKTFLRYAKEKVFGVNLYTKLVIAHDYRERGNVNHMFIPWYSFALQMSNAEVKRLIIDNDGNQALNVTVAHLKKPFQKGYGENSPLPEIHKLVAEGKPFKDIYKKYKELCARFI